MKRILTIIAVSVCASFWTYANVSQAPPSRGDLQAMNLQEEFNKRTANIDWQTKDAAKQQLNLTIQLLDECGDKVRQEELERITKTPNITLTNRFEKVLLQAYVERFLKLNDTKALERLLAVRCPEYIAIFPLEWVMASRKQCGGISILINSYKASGEKTASQVLVKCLGRAFPYLRQRYSLDAEFVNACAEWIRANNSNCTLNLKYPFLPSHEDAPNEGLFVVPERK